MIISKEEIKKREHKQISFTADIVVIGGGLSGCCAAITAARAGIKVILVSDRPVLGGNASSEIRLWALGATSHMGNNNRWAREGGVIDELLVENTFRNPEGNPLIFDTIILEKVVNESNITLLLNTAVYDLDKNGSDQISSLRAFCSQNSTQYELYAPLFCDSSGDGVVAFLAGAAFRMGAESSEEFGEKFAPSKEYGELLGHSLYFYSKDVGKAVRYVAPSYAIDITKEIPKYQRFNAREHGCQLWWLEYGGRMDTVYDTETIKWELWKVIYGLWDYIKNSGKFPEAETMTLEWVGTIPGKRESRRFEGGYILTQKDIIEQRVHEDDVAFGGWSLDLHPADGVFSEKPGCNQWHSKGIYGIPYRCLYSRNIHNLFITGRIISVSHVAFGSTRVMLTGAHGGQAVGMAAALCKQENILPADIVSQNKVSLLQQELLKRGQHIPHLKLFDQCDIMHLAGLSATSTLVLNEFEENTDPQPMIESICQMLPVKEGKMPEITLFPYSQSDTTLQVELRISAKPGNYTPDMLLEIQTFSLKAGKNKIVIQFKALIPYATYTFLIIRKNVEVSFSYSYQRVTGILSLFNLINEAVSNYGKQEPAEDVGVESFEFWCPHRRPTGHNIAMKINPGIDAFSVDNITNGFHRPTNQPNAYVADLTDPNPEIAVGWEDIKSIQKLELSFDTDFDHPMESVLMTHPENIMPFCVREFRIIDEKENILFEEKQNHQTQCTVIFEKPVKTKKIKIQLRHPGKYVPAALMEVRVYE